MNLPEYQSQVTALSTSDLLWEFEAVLIDFTANENKGEDVERVRLLRRELFRRLA